MDEFKMNNNGIIFCDVNKPTGINENNIIEHECLDIKKINNEWFLISRMGNTLEYQRKCKEQILFNQAELKRLKDMIK